MPLGPAGDAGWLHRVVVGALRSELAAHGPVTRYNIGSAAKRIVGQLTKGDRPHGTPGSSAAGMLAEFHAHPNCRDELPGLRRVLHREEHRELEAELAVDPPERARLARELADVAYLCYGTARAHGIDLDAALAEIHRAALDKLDANARRPDGKLVKFAGFVAPDMSGATR